MTVFIFITPDKLKAQNTAAFVQKLTPFGIFDSLYDRFGNKYALSDLKIMQPPAPNSVNSVPNGQYVNDMTCGYFHLWFESGSGMDNLNNQANLERREILCQVFTDISNFITKSAPPNGLPSSEVNIWVRNFASAASSQTAAAMASPFYSFPNSINAGTGGCLLDGEVWKTINGGADSYTNIYLPIITSVVNGGSQVSNSFAFFHGMITFNMNLANGNTWYQAFSTSGIGANEYDFYRIALHEATHLLGFSSLIDETGNTKLTNLIPNYYTRYDAFLSDINSNVAILTSTNSCSSMYDYNFNPALNISVLQPNPNNTYICGGSPSALTGTDITDCQNAIIFGGTTNQVVYTPACFEDGSSLSHFEDMCIANSNNNLWFIMSNQAVLGFAGAFRDYKEEEQKAFGDIGYTVGNIWGQNPNTGISIALSNLTNYNNTYVGGVAGINDGITQNSQGNLTWTYITQVNTLVSIPITDLLLNDNADEVSCPEIIFGGGMNSTLIVNGTNLDFMPATGFSGLALLRYVPKRISDNKLGNVTYIYVFVEGDCNTVCNLISNGNFENYTSGNFGIPNSGCWSELAASADIFDRNAGSLLIPTTWSNPSSDVHPNPQIPLNASNDNFMGLRAIISPTGPNYWEAAQTQFSSPIGAGDYHLSFYAKMANNFNQMSLFLPFNIDGEIEITLFNGPIITSGLSYPNITFTPPFRKFHFTVPFPTTSIPPEWAQFQVDFNIPAGITYNYFAIAFYPDLVQNPNYIANMLANTPAGMHTYMYIDDIYLYPNILTPSLTLPDFVCINTQLNLASGLNLQMQTNDQFFIDGIAINTNPPMFDASTLAPGVHNVSYSYGSCAYVLSDNITILDPHIIVQKEILNANGSNSFSTGQYVHYQITITSPTDYSNLSWEDILPSGMTFVSGSASAGISVNGNTLSAPSFSITAGVPVSFDFWAHIDAINTSNCPIQIENCANIVVGGNTTNNCNLPSGCISFSLLPTNNSTIQIIPNNSFSNGMGTILSTTPPPYNITTSIISGQTLFLDGLLSIDNDFTFQNCEIIAAPGASIEIFNGRKLTLDNTHIYACNELWDGITLLESSYLRTNNNTLIENAYRAVRVLKSGQASFRDTRFNDNYISISTSSEYANLFFDGDIMFDCTASYLLPNYDVSLPQTGIRPFCAIDVENITLTIAPSGTCTFQNQNFGIRAFNSDVLLKHCIFQNIIPTAYFNANLINGTAIYVNENSPSGSPSMPRTLFTSGYYDYANGIGQASFINCRTAIFSENMQRVNIMNHKMEGVTNGIRLWHSNNNKAADITNNYISAHNFGINLFDNAGSDMIYVHENQIDIVGTTQNLPIGISINEVSTGAFSYTVLESNHINMYSPGKGIMVNSALGTSISGSTIQLFGGSCWSGLAGIQLNGCDKIVATCNHITGSSTLLAGTGNTINSTQRGFYAEMTPNTEYNCNSTDNTAYGFDFSGFCQSTNMFAGNEMQNHYLGLNVNPNAIFGEQKIYAPTNEYMGNRWTGSYGLYAAQHLNAYFLEQFNMNSAAGSTYFPANINPSGNLWFKNPNNLNNYDCGIICNAYSRPANADSNLSNIDYAIAQNSLQSQEFETENQWAGARSLYQKLAGDSTLLNDSTMSAFYQNQQTNSVGIFHHLEGEMGKLVNLENTNKVLMDSLMQKLLLLQPQIRQLDSLYRSTNESDSSLYLQMKVLEDSLYTVRTETSLILQIKKVINDSLSLVLRDLNGYIPSQEVYEENERVVNDVYLATFGVGIYTFDSTQLENLYAIAQECPLAGGNAVFRARAMLHLVNDTLAYDDKTLCEQVNISYRQVNSNSGEKDVNNIFKVQVYPNPTNGNINFECNFLEEKYIEVYNVFGQLVGKYKWEKDASVYSLFLGNKVAGVYFYTVSTLNERISNGKFLIIK